MYNPIKYYQYIWKDTGVTAITTFLLPNTASGNYKMLHPDLCFLYTTCLLNLVYYPTKYHQCIRKGVEVITFTRFLLPNTVRGDTKTMAPRVVVLVLDMPFQPSVQSYQVSSIYLKGC